MLHKIFSFSIYVHISQQQTNHVVLTNLPAQNLPLSSLWIFPICGSLNSKKRRKKNSKLNPNSISLSFTLRLFLTPSPLLLHTHTHTKIMDIIPLTNIFRNICVTSSRIGCGMGNLNVWKKIPSLDRAEGGKEITSPCVKQMLVLLWWFIQWDLLRYYVFRLVERDWKCECASLFFFLLFNILEFVKMVTLKVVA